MTSVKVESLGETEKTRSTFHWQVLVVVGSAPIFPIYKIHLSTSIFFSFFQTFGFRVHSLKLLTSFIKNTCIIGIYQILQFIGVSALLGLRVGMQYLSENRNVQRRL